MSEQTTPETSVAQGHPYGACFDGTVTFSVEPDQYPELELTTALASLGKSIDLFRQRYGGTIKGVYWSDRQISISIEVSGRTS